MTKAVLDAMRNRRKHDIVNISPHQRKVGSDVTYLALPVPYCFNIQSSHTVDQKRKVY